MDPARRPGWRMALFCDAGRGAGSCLKQRIDAASRSEHLSRVVGHAGNQEDAMLESGAVARFEILEVVDAAPQACRALGLGGAGFVDVGTVGVVIIGSEQIGHAPGNVRTASPARAVRRRREAMTTSHAKILGPKFTRLTLIGFFLRYASVGLYIVRADGRLHGARGQKNVGSAGWSRPYLAWSCA
jgi:hypothetical protein